MTAGKHWPIDPNTPVTSPFGYRGGFAVPGSADWLAGLHDGTDFGADYGTPVYAAHAGVLSNRLDPGGYGQYVQIDADGIMTQYGHVRDMWIIPDGTWVEPGTWIAGVGSEGMSTGAHLHFRLHLDGQATDPVPWLQDAEWHPGTTTPQPTPAPLADTVQAQVYRWGIAQGLTDAGIAGLLANMQQESGFDPGVVEGMSHSLDDLVPGVREGIGLCQWSYSRREGLLAYATGQGKAWQDVDLQLAWIIEECANSGTYAAGLDALRTATDPVAAAYAWEAAYEGAAVVGPRGTFALQQYDLITSGAYGTRDTTPPAARAIPLAAIATALEETVPGDHMSAVVVYLVGSRPEGCPEVWLNIGCGFKPVRGTEPNFAQPTVANLNLSWGDFQPHLQQSLADHEDQLDGSADLGPRRIRAAVARAAAVAAGLDPDKVAAG